MINAIVDRIKNSGQLVVLMRFGSHLYGTNTPESDTDYKGIYIPKIEDVVLNNVPKSSINVSTGINDGKNTKDDIDAEFFHLRGFMHLCEEGQVCALDMLFAPDDMIIYKSPVWDEIIANRDKLLHKGTSAFIGYCRKQTAKYGLKGSRIDALEYALDKLSPIEIQNSKLSDIIQIAKDIIKKHPEYFFFGELDATPRNIGGGGIKDGDANKYLDICGRKFMYGGKMKQVVPVIQKILDGYGDRARLAQTNEGIDWKAVSHAVRVCFQSIELLETGHITFPLPNADYIRKIKIGKDLNYLPIAEDIEGYMEKVNKLKITSKLPEKADTVWMKEFIVEQYMKPVYDMQKIELKVV